MVRFIVLVLFGCITLQTDLLAQQMTEGMVSFDITYPNLPENKKQQAIYLPSNMYVLLKGDQVRMELKTILGPVISLTNSKTRESYVLSEMMGKKLAMHSTFDQVKKVADKLRRDNPVPPKQVNYTGKTKKIAGYTCKHMLLKTVIDGLPVILDAYYTEDIPPMINDLFNNGYDIEMKGFLMQYKVIQDGMEVVYTATAVEPKAISDDLFLVPKEFEIVPQFSGY
jgi:hypothetical protein